MIKIIQYQESRVRIDDYLHYVFMLSFDNEETWYRLLYSRGKKESRHRSQIARDISNDILSISDTE